VAQASSLWLIRYLFHRPEACATKLRISGF
jgi:hypothetical protein